MELFTHVTVLVAQGRNLDLITQAEAVRPYRAIRDDLWKTTYACYCAELVDRLTEERLENRAIFDLLLHQLEYLDEAPQPDELSVRAFELRLLGRLGYAPELYRCVECGEPLRPVENRISASAGGTVCATCGATHPGARPISVNAIKAMRLLAGEPFDVFQRLRLPPETGAEVEGALRAHLNYILERQLRTAEFLDRLKAGQKAERKAAAARRLHVFRLEAPDLFLGQRRPRRRARLFLRRLIAHVQVRRLQPAPGPPGVHQGGERAGGQQGALHRVRRPPGAEELLDVVGQEVEVPAGRAALQLERRRSPPAPPVRAAKQKSETYPPRLSRVARSPSRYCTRNATGG